MRDEQTNEKQGKIGLLSLWTVGRLNFAIKQGGPEADAVDLLKCISCLFFFRVAKIKYKN